MSVRMSLTFALLIASAGAAAAQEMCGDPPIAPVIVSAAEMRAKAPADAAATEHGGFADIRRWQGSLKSYRDCLSATIAADRRSALEAARSEKPDKDKIARFNDEILASGRALDASSDLEERVVNEFHAAQVAYCTRKDVDVSSCPKT
ncbi:MAG TPA: hypothetical protein VKR31_01605 [Rhizomicrobium sp.]|nr:hypothetical protein [Rhizomicrobium sp.]